MRLFIAINFNDDVKRKLADVQQKLKSYTFSGSYTAYENLHLTVVFLGEIPNDRIPSLIEIIDSVKFEPFNICIKGIGSFKNNGDDIVWIGIDPDVTLAKIHDELSTRLISAGFGIEKRKFVPHLTLIRRAKMKNGFNPEFFFKETDAILSKVSRISLMKSERAKNGGMIYTEINT